MSFEALVLFGHGARDPRWALPFQRLQKMTQDSSPELRVELAFLEFMTPGLPDLAAQLAKDGCTKMSLVPVFLGQGGHVLRDLPILLENLKQAHPEMSIHLSTAVGEDESVLSAIRDYCLKQV